MYYWNKSNFEGLLKLADEFDKFTELQLLANYCRLREQGLRRSAFQTLDAFLEASHTFNESTARITAVKILESNALTTEAHQFLTQPLMTQFLNPTLRAWMDAEPEANVPVRWLGMMSRDYTLLETALLMDPDDVPVRKLLIERELSIADWITHHLDESVLLGPVENVVIAMQRAKNLIAGSSDPDAFAYFNLDVHYYCALVEDWKAYSDSREGSFADWCEKKGRKYNYPTKFYYNQ